MTQVVPLAEAIALLGARGAATEAAQHRAMAAACRMLAAEARAMFAQGGVAGGSATSPEIPITIGTAVSQAEGRVGVDDEAAVARELGTSRTPPRAFLGAAAMRAGERVASEIGRRVAAALAGQQSDTRPGGGT